MTADSNQRPLCLATQPVAQSAHTHTHTPPPLDLTPDFHTRQLPSTQRSFVFGPPEEHE